MPVFSFNLKGQKKPEPELLDWWERILPWPLSKSCPGLEWSFPLSLTSSLSPSSLSSSPPISGRPIYWESWSYNNCLGLRDTIENHNKSCKHTKIKKFLQHSHGISTLESRWHASKQLKTWHAILIHRPRKVCIPFCQLRCCFCINWKNRNLKLHAFPKNI